ncbi:efflux RND transporter periplasmic adaptor subunit [Roseobacter litoralis]|uniref:efflux RND transporter periplasmic adaptor subunit n=1 Tax=Roseobacter litoralis TaxID=42443 RepID=UPI0024956992|nr:efflux RND transporter periplasmic adaptor subunit [Roseobacter litoralis]
MGLLLAALAYSQLWMAGPSVVAVEIARMAPVTRLLAVNGRIAAVNSVDIRPVVTGSLSVLSVAEGDLVTADQILAQIDAAAQSAIVRQAMAGLDAALVTQQQATENYDRALSLGPNIARTVLETDAHVVQTAAQEVARQTATLGQAQVVLGNHTLRAPRAGTVVALDAELGQLAGPTISLLTLADLSDLVVEADVDEAYATQVALGQPAVLQLAGDTRNRDGHVSFVSDLVDVSTGGLAVKIAFETPVMAPIGLTVATNIIVESRDAAVTVPRTALQTGVEGTGILVVRKGTAVFQPLTVVEWPAARLIATDGLAEGDTVIIDPTDIEIGQAVVSDQP